MLHPLYDALGFTWERGKGMERRRFPQRPAQPSDRFLRSPYYHLLNNNLDHLRRRIDHVGAIGVSDLRRSEADWASPTIWLSCTPSRSNGARA